MMVKMTYLAGRLFYLQAPLDRDAWLDGKDGMDFNEAPPQASEINPDMPMPDIAEWEVILRYLAIAVLAALLVFVVVKLVSRKSNKLSKAKAGAEEIEPDDEGPTALSPMEELWEAHRRAKEAGNFREAIRVLYQITIKHLDGMGKLKAAADKTNREYTREMSWEEKAPDFFKLTLLHEFSWYGAKDVDQSDFDRSEPRFLSFIESIKNG